MLHLWIGESNLCHIIKKVSKKCSKKLVRVIRENNLITIFVANCEDTCARFEKY